KPAHVIPPPLRLWVRSNTLHFLANAINIVADLIGIVRPLTRPPFLIGPTTVEPFANLRRQPKLPRIFQWIGRNFNLKVVMKVDCKYCDLLELELRVYSFKRIDHGDHITVTVC